MMGAVGLEEKSLGQWSNIQVGTLKEQTADLHAQWSTAGFACVEIRDAAPDQPAGEQFDLRCLARAIQALKRD